MNRVPRRAEGLEWSRVGDKLVILDAAGKKLRGLNATGERVWELMNGARSTQQIAEQLSTDCRVPSARTARDVEAFVAELCRTGLVTMTEGDTSP